MLNKTNISDVTPMLKKSCQLLSIVLLLTGSQYCLSAGLFENGKLQSQSDSQCSMKNLNVNCEKGDNIRLDVTRSENAKKGEVFLTINSKEDLGDYVLLYINNRKPEIVKMEKAGFESAIKRVYLSRSLILKIKDATSLQFKISMLKRRPIHGSLTQYHFDWLKQFGNKCS